jgi:hypothetical protein
MIRRPVSAGFGRVMVPPDKIWLHLTGEDGGIEDEIVLSVEEARDVIATLQSLVAQAQPAVKA